MQKKTWYAVSDAALVLLVGSTLFSLYCSNWIGTLCRFAALLLYVVAKFSIVRETHGKVSLAVLQSVGWLLVVLSIQLGQGGFPIWGTQVLSVVGILMILLARHFIYQKEPRTTPVWVKGVLILFVLVRLGVPLTESLARLSNQGYAGESPFGHTYRVDAVLNGSESGKSPIAVVELSHEQQLSLTHDLMAGEWAVVGKFTYIQQEDSGSAEKGLWECVPEDGNNLIYQLTADQDDGLSLWALQDGVVQWHGALKRIDTLVCTVKTTGVIGSVTPDWFPENTFDGDTKYLSFGDIHKEGTITFSWRQNPPDCLTVKETFYGSGSVSEQEYTLSANQRGEFDLSVQTPSEGYAIYTVPFETGEYVFGVRYS